jgi:POT family proton-dependent oligopeptide transporter
MEEGTSLLGSNGSSPFKSQSSTSGTLSPGLSSSRQSSRPSSPTLSDNTDDLPTDVNRADQLSLLPDECLSGDKNRPLRHVTEIGADTLHALNPLTFAVGFILVVELLERFAFYGINYTQTSYLTGAYNDHWNAGMHAVEASTYVSISVAVAYTTPFLGAYLADHVLGDYWSILCGSLCFYLPGILLIALTTIPGFLGTEFNTTALQFGLLCLWPIGTGIVKSCVNVFGARQFHPLLQSSLIESYFVSFYMCINVGSVLGGIAVPVLAQTNVTWAYFLPVVMLSAGSLIFLCGSPRYIKSKPIRSAIFGGKKKSKSVTNSESSGSSFNLGIILRISLLVVPFNIGKCRRTG